MRRHRSGKVFRGPEKRGLGIVSMSELFFYLAEHGKESIKKKDLYHPEFKLNEDEMQNMISKPDIPPLLKNA